MIARLRTLARSRSGIAREIHWQIARPLVTGEDILRQIEAEFASLPVQVWEDAAPGDVRPGVIYVSRAWAQARDKGRAA